MKKILEILYKILDFLSNINLSINITKNNQTYFNGNIDKLTISDCKEIKHKKKNIKNKYKNSFIPISIIYILIYIALTFSFIYLGKPILHKFILWNIHKNIPIVSNISLAIYNKVLIFYWIIYLLLFLLISWSILYKKSTLVPTIFFIFLIFFILKVISDISLSQTLI